MKKLSLSVALLAAFVGTVSADVIWSNSTTGTNPGLVSPYTAGQTFDANITVSGIGRGSGVAGANGNDRYNATGWNSSSFDSNDYFFFILTPNSGFQINFADFSYAGAQASGTGPVSFSFRSSLDGFGSSLASPTVGAGGIPAPGSVSLTGLQFQGVTGGIEFRFYGWGASASTGTFSINDFTFNGTVTPVAPTVPES